MRKLQICTCTSISFGVVALIIGAIILCLLPVITRNRVKNEVPLRNGSETERMWQTPPYDAFMQFWIFDLQNPHEVINKGAQPLYVERGPYSYREVEVKTVFDYTANGTILYRSNKTYFFDNNTSCANCSKTDLVTVPNIPYMTFIYLIRGKVPFALRPWLSFILKTILREYPFTMQKVQVDQLIFTGYPDTLLSLLNFLASVLKITIPGFHGDKMSLFGSMNGTSDGVYEIHSGIENVEDVGRIISWDGRMILDYWNVTSNSSAEDLSGKSSGFVTEVGDNGNQSWISVGVPNYFANTIDGSDGTLFPPFLTKHAILHMFSSQVCRSVSAKSMSFAPKKHVANKSTSYPDEFKIYGIPTHRFFVPLSSFDASSKENKGFCWRQSDGFFSDDCAGVEPTYNQDGCLMSGFLNISYGPNNGCHRDEILPYLPLVMSNPHFMSAPECVRKALNIDSDPDNHIDEFGTMLDVELTTGAALRLARRIQLNVPIFRHENISGLKKIKPAIYPILWLNETAVISPKAAKGLYNQLIRPKAIALGFGWTFIGIGVATLFIVAVACVLYKHRMLPYYTYLDGDDQEPIIT